MPHDSHFIKWIETKFGVEVWFTGLRYRVALCDNWSYPNASLWLALCDYASCYDGAMSDKLVEYEV